MASGGNAGKSPVLNSSNSNDSGILHSESSKDSKENLGKGSTEPPNPDPKQKNRLAQKRFRDRSKQKYDILEETVLAMSKRLEELEERKAGLLAEVDVFRTQQSYQGNTKRVLLPQIEAVEPDFVPAVSWAGFNPAGRGGLVLKAVFEQPRRLTREQAVKLSVQDIRDFHEEFLLKSGQLLVQNPNEDWHSLAGIKLKELVDERNGFCCYMAFWVPLSSLKLNDISEIRNKSLNTEPPDYERLIGKCKLTTQQKQQLRDATREYMTNTINLHLQRDRLKEELLAFTLEEQGPKQLQSLQFSHAVRTLRDNVDHMHIVHCVFWATVFSNPDLLNFFQEARMLLEAWPYIPDPGELYAELERQYTGRPAELHELSPQLPRIKQEYEQPEETPYVDVMDKLMLEFSKVGLWHFQRGAESSPGVVKIQQS